MIGEMTGTILFLLQPEIAKRNKEDILSPLKHNKKLIR
jgi:hypothetical protein